MKPVTIAEAARLTRTSKSTIQRAVKNHELSATRDDQDRWLIDPAELSRLFEVHHDAAMAQPGALETKNTPESNQELNQLRHEKLEIQYRAEKEKADLLQSQVDDLRNRLDRSETTLLQVTALLPRPAEPDTPPVHQTTSKTEPSSASATPRTASVHQIKPTPTPIPEPIEFRPEIPEKKSWLSRVLF